MEICKACEGNNELKETLPESVKVPIQLVENVLLTYPSKVMNSRLLSQQQRTN